jgi:DNA repair exonuclease SbcCD ATPase subunit
MSELKPKKITIRNWMTINEAVVEFPDSGIVLVTGSNKASGGVLESVGSGKTALGEALSRALVGTEGRYRELGYYSTNDKGNSLIEVEADLRGKPLVVQMGYKCKDKGLSKTGGALRFKYGEDDWISRSSPDETRKELINTLRITPELAKWTVYIDGDALRFSKMSQKDSVNLLMAALAQPPWSVYHKKAGEAVSNWKKEVAKEQATHQQAKVNLSDLKQDIKCAEEDLADSEEVYKQALEENQRRIQSLEEQIAGKREDYKTEQAAQKKLKKQIELAVEQVAVKMKAIEQKRLQLVSSIATKNTDRSTQNKAVGKASALVDNAEERLEEMLRVPKDCPQCGRPWDKAHGDEEINKQEAEIKRLDGLCQEERRKLDKIEKELRKLQDEQTAVMEEASAARGEHDTKHLSRKYEDSEGRAKLIQTDISNFERQLDRLKNGPDRSTVDKFKAIVEERYRLLEKAEEKVRTTSESLAESEIALSVVEYWYEAYGPYGIPNMILRDSIAPLNMVAKRISNLLTGGTIEIAYSTSRELADGRDSAELVTTVKNKIGANRVEGSSKGEGGLTNLIIAETLSEVGCVSARIGYRWYDEVLTSQDAVSRRNILSYLKDIAQRLGILIFVVDHHGEAANYADHILIAEKTDKGTTFRWR